MKIAATALVLATATAFATSTAQARHIHHYRHYAHHEKHHYKHVESGERVFYSGPAYKDVAEADERYLIASHSDYAPIHPSYAHSYDRGSVIGGRPAGCPYAFCGCEASRYLFGRIIPDLNLAYNWIRKFPRTAAAPGMAAARNHHVMVLISHAGGNDWLVHDGNSGHHLTREHVRSIAGYVIVNPHGSRYAYNG